MNLPPLDPLRETRFALFFDKTGHGDDFDDDDDDEVDDELAQDEEDRTNDEN